MKRIFIDVNDEEQNRKNLNEVNISDNIDKYIQRNAAPKYS